jgi:putative redox protein
LLIGHSLGGAAALVAASSIPSVRAVATVAAPSDTVHLAQLLSSRNSGIEVAGEGLVSIGGIEHRITRQMLETLREFDFASALANVEVPVLVFHSPVDETLAWSHAERIFRTVRGPRALVTVDGADHLLVNQPGDVDFVAQLIAVWSRRYLQ